MKKLFTLIIIGMLFTLNNALNSAALALLAPKTPSIKTIILMFTHKKTECFNPGDHFKIQNVDDEHTIIIARIAPDENIEIATHYVRGVDYSAIAWSPCKQDLTHYAFLTQIVWDKKTRSFIPKPSE